MLDSLSLQRFNKAAFEQADDAGKAALAEQLGQLLTAHLLSGSDLDRAVRVSIALLRKLGHDLWSWDEDGESMSVWGPNYGTPTGPGIVVMFNPTGVEVDWTFAFAPRPPASRA